MPKAVEDALKKRARKMGLKGDRFNAYVYGTLQKITDWTPGQQRALDAEERKKKRKK